MKVSNRKAVCAIAALSSYMLVASRSAGAQEPPQTDEPDAPTAAPGEVLAQGLRYDVVMGADGWVEHQHHVSLQDLATADAAATRRTSEYAQQTVTGKVVTSEGVAGCQYSGEIRSSDVKHGPGYVYVQREVREQPADCMMVTEGAWLRETTALSSGVVPPDVANESGGAAGVGSGGETAAAPASGQTAAATYAYDGRIRGYVEDPPNADVNSTTARIHWNWHPSCATVPAWQRVWAWYWLSGTGWTDVEKTQNGGSGGCGVTQHTFGKYKNGVFCASNDTWAQQDVTFIAQYKDVSWASWNVQKWGGCSWLLDANHYYDPK